MPRVTAAAGCGGSGRELARFGDLRLLDAFLLGPVGLPGEDAAVAPVLLRDSPSGLVHTMAPVIDVDHVVGDLLPWFAARGIPVVCAVRGSTVGAVTATLQRLRRSLDFAAVRGVEVDLAAARADTRPAIGVLAEVSVEETWSADPQSCLKLLAAAREQVPRDLLLTAKFGGECPDPVATARAAVGGGARALVLSGSVPALGPGQHLVGPAIAAVTLGLLARVRAAVAAARVPDVPLVAVGGVRDRASAVETLVAGAHAVQLGSGILADPELLWDVHDALPAVPSHEPGADRAP